MTEGRADTAAFVAALPALAAGGAFLFAADREIAVARAPGRLDVMGGIADYSGSLVLQMPLAAATLVAAQACPAPEILVASFAAAAGPPRVFRAAVPELLGRPAEALARVRTACTGGSRWAGYVLGTLAMLVAEGHVSRPGGVRVAIRSTVPEGAGVSSSAALEVAAMGAFAALHGAELALPVLARLCQRVEHEVCGAPCGIMDQMTAALGREGHLLALLCQPAEVQGHVALPAGVAVWGIDSGVRHQVAGEDYRAVRTAAAMGYRILADAVGLPVREGSPGRVEIDDPHWRGHLANVSPMELDHDLLPLLPRAMRGAEFLARYDGVADAATSVDPARTYRVRAATCHPIREHARTRQFAAALAAAPTEENLRRLGAWMEMSHAGYSDCGLGSAATDRIADLARALGPSRGLYGARITGGGGGGTVAILGRAEAGEVIAAITARLRAETGREHAVFPGSSPGLAVQLVPPRLRA
ncbi:MAG: galactokinase family protein [Planctomycetota bacterium]